MSQYDITCPTVTETALDKNTDATFDHPRQPQAPIETRRQYYWDHSRPVLITSRSPLPLRRSTEKLARYFRREFGYDFVNFDARERDPDCEAWLWITRDFASAAGWCATGHAVFWKIAFHDRPGPEWQLGSAWQHPYFRGHGRLTAIWPHWARSYGPFWVETPWSPAMQAFLSRTAHQFPDGKTSQDLLASHRARHHTDLAEETAQ